MVRILEYDQNYAAQQLRRSRHPLRRIIKYFYLNNILHDVRGPTIDFGCGAGQLLARLPPGSIGLEVNPYLVEELRTMGLKVILYDADIDQFSFRELPQNYYKTLVMAHVLEHFADAAQVLGRLLHSCGRLGIQRVILVVPGTRGFQFDKTHNTFVNQFYLKEQGLLYCVRLQSQQNQLFPV